MTNLSNQPKKGDVYYSVMVSINNKKIGQVALDRIRVLHQSFLLKWCKKTEQRFDKWVIDNSTDVIELYKKNGYTVDVIEHIY